jgi:hypothetical protein
MLLINRVTLSLYTLSHLALEFIFLNNNIAIFVVRISRTHPSELFAPTPKPRSGLFVVVMVLPAYVRCESIPAGGEFHPKQIGIRSLNGWCLSPILSSRSSSLRFRDFMSSVVKFPCYSTFRWYSWRTFLNSMSTTRTLNLIGSHWFSLATKFSNLMKQTIKCIDHWCTECKCNLL